MTTTTANYVVGFMFNEALTQVALIRKQKPEWQRNKLNGIGGKVEENEPAPLAMMREFKEETGVQTYPGDWIHVADMDGGNNDDGGSFYVAFFASKGDLSKLQTTEDEKIEIVSLHELDLARADTVENLVWLAGLAADSLHDGRPSFAQVRYP